MDDKPHAPSKPNATKKNKRLDKILLYKIAPYNLSIVRTYKCFVTYYLRYIDYYSDDKQTHDSAVQLDMDDKDQAPAKPNDGKKNKRLVESLV